jgi:hypothetical protein
MLRESLTEENYLVYCAKVYYNPGMLSSKEFLEDLNRVIYVKKLLNRYEENGELKERLILNHLITLHNCFGPHLAKILFLKNERQYHYLKPFLILINALPSVIYNVGDRQRIYTDEIPLDQNIVYALRRVSNV